MPHAPVRSGLRHERFAYLARQIAPREDDRALIDVLRADFDAQRNTAHFPVVELKAGRLLPIVSTLTPTVSLAVCAQLFDDVTRFFVVVLEDGHDDGLNRRESGRQDQALIVAVHHDDGADHAPR